MSSNKYKSIIFASIFLFSTFYFLLSTPVFAAELKYQFPCSPIAGGTCPTAEQTAQSPAAYIARFYQFALMISGALAFGMIIFGAIQYIVSAGNATTQKDAADRIFQALWGIALLFGAYLILYTIDPKLVSLTDPNIEIIKLPEYKLPEYLKEVKPGVLETVGGTEKIPLRDSLGNKIGETEVTRVGEIQYTWVTEKEFNELKKEGWELMYGPSIETDACQGNSAKGSGKICISKTPK
ncbi:MAG: hypothetical protein Q8N22_02060 [bacterium]|nr:hypothetical protein [bacterium]